MAKTEQKYIKFEREEHTVGKSMEHACYTDGRTDVYVVTLNHEEWRCEESSASKTMAMDVTVAVTFAN